MILGKRYRTHERIGKTPWHTTLKNQLFVLRKQMKWHHSFGEFVIVEPTNICDYHCPLCRTPELTRSKGYMPFLDFVTIINDLKQYFHQIRLNMTGEPLLNKDLPIMVDYASRLNLHTIIYTNGSHLKEMAKTLVQANLTEIQISLDGITQQTYEKYRVGGNLEQVIEGIKTLTAIPHKTTVAIQFLVMRHNEHEIPKAINLCRNLGVDKLRLKSVNIDYKPFNTINELQTRAETWLPKNEKWTRYHIQPDGSIKTKKAVEKCSFLHKSMILCNGDVVPCCYDMDGEYVVGNILKDGYMKVWRSKQYQKVRKQIADLTLPICHNCQSYSLVEEISF